ncbi:MAG TPA: hypothetical protein VGF93_21035 [Solirubrobacteraceae bacterium]
MVAGVVVVVVDGVVVVVVFVFVGVVAVVWVCVVVVSVVSVWVLVVCCDFVWHWLRASALVRDTPSVRLARSVGLTDDGRFETSFDRFCVALMTPVQSPLTSAEDTESSWSLIPDACPPESRPEPPPQATTNEAANPRTPARIARGACRIRPVTLETRPVGIPLGGVHWP